MAFSCLKRVNQSLIVNRKKLNNLIFEWSTRNAWKIWFYWFCKYKKGTFLIENCSILHPTDREIWNSFILKYVRRMHSILFAFYCKWLNQFSTIFSIELFFSSFFYDDYNSIIVIPFGKGKKENWIDIVLCIKYNIFLSSLELLKYETLIYNLFFRIELLWIWLIDFVWLNGFGFVDLKGWNRTTGIALGRAQLFKRNLSDVFIGL